MGAGVPVYVYTSEYSTSGIHPQIVFSSLRKRGRNKSMGASASDARANLEVDDAEDGIPRSPFFPSAH